MAQKEMLQAEVHACALRANIRQLLSRIVQFILLAIAFLSLVAEVEGTRLGWRDL
jgi:hypothetical protein